MVCLQLIKRTMDVLDVYAWVRIHRGDLADCFVDNAYRSKYYWLLKLRCGGDSRFLKIEPGVRIHISSTEPDTKTIDNYTRFLRAHVRDTRINRVDMPWWERIVVLNTGRRGREYVHYVELVPRGLWVITSPDGKILYASKFEEFKDRVIKPGVQYKPPPQKGLNPLDKTALIESIEKGRDLVRGIVYEWGLPGYIAEELLHRAGLYGLKNAKPSDVGVVDLDKLVSEYIGLLREVEAGYGYLVLGEGAPELFTPYKPILFTEVFTREIRAFRVFDEAIEAFYAGLEAFIEAEERRKVLEEEVNAWRRRVEEQERVIREYEVELEGVNRVLEAIYGNYHLLSRIIDCVLEVRRSKGWDYLGECGVSGYDKGKGVVFIDVAGERLAFNVREPLDKQVIELERVKGEISRKIERAKKIMEELAVKVASAEKEAKKMVYAKPAPRYWYEKYRWSITRNGFLVVAGRDASQNEVLVKKYLGGEDIFLHADIHGAPATILFRHGREPSLVDIEDAAYIAASYSRAWKAGFSYIDVFWVKGFQVSKSPPSGEYLARGAFMIYGERSYVKTRLVLGIGLRLFCDTIYGDYVKVFAGSPEVVKSTSLSYVILTPGDSNAGELSSTVRRILVEKAMEKTGVEYSVTSEQVLELMPGDSRIIEYGVGSGGIECTGI